MSKQVNSRIVLIVNSFPKLSETFIVNKFTGLLSRGVDVHVVCGKSKKQDWSAFPELCEDSDTKRRVHETWPITPKFLAALLLPFGLLRGLVKAPKTTLHYLSLGYKRFGFNIFKRFYLDQELICLKPDIIHFEFGSIAVGRTYIKHLLNTKISVSFRGYDLNYIGLDKPEFYKEVWKASDSCHFLGEDLFIRAKKRGYPENLKFRLIPPAINIEEFPIIVKGSRDNPSSSEKVVRILSVGRLEWKKGYEYALSSIKLLIDKGIRCDYRIVGEGSFRQAIQFSIIDLGLQDVVELCGALNHAEIIEKLYSTDIFLHAAVSEGFGNAVLEAQAAGVPVICSNADGLSENVLDGVSGFVVPRRNVIAMTEKLELLSTNEKLRHTMGAAGRERVERLFQLENQIDSWISFYKELSK